MFQTGLVQNHNIGIAGTSGTTSYNINLSYMNQEGTMRGGYDFKRYNINSNGSVTDQTVVESGHQNLVDP